MTLLHWRINLKPALVVTYLILLRISYYILSVFVHKTTGFSRDVLLTLHKFFI